MEKDLKTIQLFDEDGNEINLNVIAFFDMVNPETEEKSEYVIVQEQGYEDENPFALKVIKDEEDNDIFELIENEVELAAIEEAYNTIFMELQDKITNVIGSYNKLNLFDIKDDNELIENINKVTKEDIEKFTSKVYPHLCYFLKGE